MPRPRWLLLLFALPAAAGAVGQPDQPGEQAALLRDRTAGEPRSCINPREILGTSTVGEASILYRTSSGTIYRNDPPGGCAGLRPNMALVSYRPKVQLCEGDIVQIRDPQTGAEFGSCTLGRFTPFSRAEEQD